MGVCVLPCSEVMIDISEDLLSSIILDSVHCYKVIIELFLAYSKDINSHK